MGACSQHPLPAPRDRTADKSAEPSSPLPRLVLTWRTPAGLRLAVQSHTGASTTKPNSNRTLTHTPSFRHTQPRCTHTKHFSRPICLPATPPNRASWSFPSTGQAAAEAYVALRRQGEDDMGSIVLGVGQQLLRPELAAAFRASFTGPFEVRSLQGAGRGGARQGGTGLASAAGQHANS